MLIMGKKILIKIEPKDIKKQTANLADSGEVPHVIKNTANFYIKKK